MLDKSRPIYFAMDHTNSKDKTICNNIVNKLTQQGFTVKRNSIGPNAMYQNMKYLYDNNIKNAIMFHLFNGVDPSNIKEVAKNGSDNRGKKVRKNGNDVVLAWFYDACDCTRSDGNCYNSVRGSETHGSRFYNPKQYMDNNDIYYINQSSDNGRHKDRADYTGDKIVTAFVALFDNNTSTSGEEQPIANSDTSKTLKSVVIEKTYSTPNYNKTYSTVTDENGAFQNHLNLNIAGRYIARLHYAGDLKTATSTRSIEIDNQKGLIVDQKLLETKTTFNYSDNTSETLTDGYAEDLTDTITVISTTQYNQGTAGETTTVTRDNNKVDFTFVKQEQGSSDQNKVNPFETNAFVNNIPMWVSRMQVGNSPFEYITNSTYEITLEQFKEVFDRDSKTLQIMGNLSNYTAFRCTTESEKYILLPRTQWNAILESIYYYMVEHKGIEWPKKFTINVGEEKTTIQGEDVYWKSSSVEYYWVRDKQDTGYTCGPTSCSVATQVLMKYYSEQYLQKRICASSRSGSGASTHRDKLNDLGFSAKLNTDINEAVKYLKENKPTTWHIKGHYITLSAISTDDQILVINSVNSTPTTGWYSKSTVNGWKYKKFPQSVLIGLNWNISDAEKTQYTNFYNSMGGAWNINGHTNKTEKIRLAEYGYSYPVKWNSLSFWTYKRYSATSGTNVVNPTITDSIINMGRYHLVVLKKKIPVKKADSSIFFDVQNKNGANRVFLGPYTDKGDTYDRSGLNILLTNVVGTTGAKKTVELRFKNNLCTIYVDGTKTSSSYDFGTWSPDMHLAFYAGTENTLYVSNITYNWR